MRQRCWRRGTASLEFAVIIGPVLVLFFAVVQIGQLAEAQHAIDLAAATSARYAAIHGASSANPATVTSIQAAFTTSITPALGSTGVTPTITVTFSPNNKPGSTVTVAATYTWTGGVTPVPMPSVTLSTQAAMTIFN